MARRRRRPHAPDPFQRTFRAFFAQLWAMRWLVLAGVVSVAFVLAGLVFLSDALGEVEDAAWEKFDAGSTPEEMEELARNYGRYVGPHAWLRMGNMLFGKAQEAADADEKRALLSRARDGFSTGTKLYPGHFLAPCLLEGEGLCLEEMGRHDEAFAAFQRAYDADPKGHLAPKLEADMGRNLILMGDEEGALHYLYRAIDSGVRVGPGMEADWLLNARLLRAEVKSKELEAPPAAGEDARPEAPEAETGAEAAPDEAPAGGEEAARPEKPVGGGREAEPAAVDEARAAGEEEPGPETPPAAEADE